MAYVALASASGAPGVTTSALALALASPNPTLLIEADVCGASTLLAGWFEGRPPHTKGIVNLALARHSGAMSQAIRDVIIEIPGSNVNVVAGLRSHAQIGTIAPLWDELAEALQALDRAGMDIIVDVGRLGMLGAALPLVYRADLALLTLRTSLPAVSGARSWAASLRETFMAQGNMQSLGLLIVGEGRAYSGREVSEVLGLPPIAALAWDPSGAEVFYSGKHVRRWDASSLGRSVRSASSVIREHARMAHDRLDQHTATAGQGVSAWLDTTRT